MTLCANPVGCGHGKSSHNPVAGYHECLAADCDCPGWTLPPCDDKNGGCGHTSTVHGLLDPHACEAPGSDLGHCEGYVFPAGETRDTYQGGGGSFGGGGASGGW